MFRKKPTTIQPPSWMIVGLGNPGPQYRGTRHNIGFEVIDQLAARHRIKVATGRQKALVGHGEIDETAVLLVKPLTFMNLSGQSVGPLAKQVGVLAPNLLVVSDDLDLPLGALRLRDSGGTGGHNGHKSLQAALGAGYPRLRIGIGRGEEGTVDHVLSTFHAEEKPDVERAVRAACRIVEHVVAGRWQDALLETDRHNQGT